MSARVKTTGIETVLNTNRTYIFSYAYSNRTPTISQLILVILGIIRQRGTVGLVLSTILACKHASVRRYHRLVDRVQRHNEVHSNLEGLVFYCVQTVEDVTD